MSENRIPLIGEKFPEITAVTSHGKMDLPKHYTGKWFVLFSHPADFTPVCTTEFIAFAKSSDEFRKQNCELIGLSMDQVFSHLKWTEWIAEKMKVAIPFPIIADHGLIAAKLGMVHPGKGSNTVRAVFIVDDKGIIRMILYYPQECGRSIPEILRVVRAMQVSDKNGVAMPANWPDNEILKDRVIIPPASDEKTAQSRMKEYECYDWWFCHKKL